MKVGRSSKTRSQGFVSITAAMIIAGSSLIAIVGSGNSSTVLGLFDGNAWLSSDAKGEVAHVSGSSGGVDARIVFKGAKGQKLQVIQRGKRVYVRNLRTATLSRVDTAKLDVSKQGAVKLGAQARFVAGRSVAYRVDPSTGTVRQLDATSLQPRGRPVHLSAPLTNGVIDGNEHLWVASMANGRIFEISQGHIRNQFRLARAGSKIQLVIAAGNPVAVDLARGQVITLGDDGVDARIHLPNASGHKLLVAQETPDGRVRIVVADTGTLFEVTIEDGQTSSIPLGNRDGHELGVPEVSSDGTVYVPDFTKGEVVQRQADGNRTAIPFSAPGQRFDVVVRDDAVFLNDPSSSSALVIEPDGTVHEVDKYPPDVPGNAQPILKPPPPLPSPTPQPQQPRPTAGPQPGNGPPTTLITVPRTSPRTQPTTQPTTKPTAPPTPVTTPKIPPGAPAVTATASTNGSGTINVSWAPPTDPGSAPVSSYAVSVAPSISCQVAGSSCAATGTVGQIYTFTVVATNADGLSGPGGQASATPTAPPPPPPPPTPTVGLSIGGSAVGQPGCSTATCKFVNASVSNAPAGASVRFQCAESPTTLGTFPVKTVGADGNGNASVGNLCYFGYPGNSLWVVATINGVSYESGHITWS